MAQIDYPAMTQLISSAPAVVQESKAGFRTTEFWITIVTALSALIGALPAPDNTGGPLAAFIGAAYVISRGIAKKGVAHVEVPEA